MQYSIAPILASAVLLLSHSAVAQTRFGADESTAPARWALGTSEAKEFPRSVGQAIQKYGPKYTNPGSLMAARLLLKLYMSKDERLAAEVVGLGRAAMIPTGDMLLAATDEYDASAIWLSTRRNRLLATDEQWESVQADLLRAHFAVWECTRILKSLCDERVLVLFKRLNFRIRHDGTDPALEIMVQKEIDDAIDSIRSGSCQR